MKIEVRQAKKEGYQCHYCNNPIPLHQKYVKYFGRRVCLSCAKNKQIIDFANNNCSLPSSKEKAIARYYWNLLTPTKKRKIIYKIIRNPRERNIYNGMERVKWQYLDDKLKKLLIENLQLLLN
jgi:hypothetical protein